MKTIRNNHVMPTIADLKKHPIHNYGGKKTLSGRVLNNSIRAYRRKDDSCQLVFEMAVNDDSRVYVEELELYVKDEREWSAARQLLISGQLLTVDCCLRADQYMDPRGFPTERRFLFVSGVDGLRPMKTA